jgi:hypothetical protein
VGFSEMKVRATIKKYITMWQLSERDMDQLLSNPETKDITGVPVWYDQNRRFWPKPQAHIVIEWDY